MQHDGVDRLTQAVEHRRQRLRLRDVARKAVEDETVRGVGPRQALADQGEHQVVGDQLAGVHRRLGPEAQLGAARNRIAQQIAGGNLGHAALLGEPLCLGALAGAGRSEKNDSHVFDLLDRRSCIARRRPAARKAANVQTGLRHCNIAILCVFRQRESTFMASSRKNAFYAQSGGVSAVINASACGRHRDGAPQASSGRIGKVYAGP